MSDPTTAPFTQTPPMPELQFDSDGRAWIRAPGGNWSMVPQQSPQVTYEPAGHSAAPVQPAVQPTMRNFPLSAAGHSHAQASIHAFPHIYDPALVPLPEGADLDLSDPATIAKSRGLKAAPKVAGVRQKIPDPKGKKRHYSSDSGNDSEDEPIRKRGRRKGSPNWKVDEVNKLLDYVEKYLPLGQKGWKSVTRRYHKWASGSHRPERDGKALETKYKTLLKTKKPTGDGHCPPEIKRVHRIEALINERAGTRELTDSDIDGAADASSDDSGIEVLSHSTAVHTAVARRAPTPPLRRNTRNPRMNAPELVNKLSQAFDPDTLKSRDDARSERSFQSAQLFTISQQLRDAQGTIESLRTQINVLQQHTHDIERARDRAEFKLEMLQDGDESRRVRVRSDTRVNGKIRYQSDADSEKENVDPSPPSHARSLRPQSSSSGPSVAGTSTVVDAGLE